MTALRHFSDHFARIKKQSDGPRRGLRCARDTSTSRVWNSGIKAARTRRVTMRRRHLKDYAPAEDRFRGRKPRAASCVGEWWSMNLKRLGIGVAGVATLIVVLAERGESTKPVGYVAAPEERRAAAESHAATRKEIIDGLPRRPDLGRQRAELFAPVSEVPVRPQPPASVLAAPAPVPPPNPYRFAGAVSHDGKSWTFLTDGARLYDVHAGDELDGQYRVEVVTADEVVLLYVPLGSRHPMAARSALSSDSAATMAAAGVVLGGSPPDLPPGSPLMAAAGEPASASTLPPGSPLIPRAQ
jgi:hypothetical protein